MVLVGPHLVEAHVRSSKLLSRAWDYMVRDVEIQELLRMSNVNAVTRLLYNDHGPVHATIVSGASLEILNLLLEAGVIPSSLAQGIVGDVEYSKLIVLLGAYLHDIGNSVHRHGHEYTGALIAYNILSRMLPEILPVEDVRLIYRVRSEVMNVIYSTAMEVDALTIEASIVKVADGTDMAEGRARIPYSRGKMDMHALSALSIKKVEIEQGGVRPVRIRVTMNSYAGYFQLEQVLLPKIRRSLIGEYIEIVPELVLEDGRVKPLPPINP
jgi:metal-dependent HD superfamily phosphatase/phosphodiesterase